MRGRKANEVRNRLAEKDILAARGDRALYLNDGGGLYLQVTPGGSKSWQFIRKAHGKRVRLGLGPIQDVSLDLARAKAAALRLTQDGGGDPKLERDRHGYVRRRSTADSKAGFVRSEVSPASVSHEIYHRLCKIWGDGYIRECFGGQQEFDPDGSLANSIIDLFFGCANPVPINDVDDTPQALSQDHPHADL